MRLPFAISLVLFPLICFSTTIPRVSMEELFKNADTVAIVEIVNGRTLGEGKQSCGAIYTGRIESLFKGNAKNQIEFGYLYGYSIGARYLLFLTNPDKNYEPITSTNSMQLAHEAEILKRCRSKFTSNKIMHSGYGGLRIPFDSNEVIVETKYVELPTTIKSTKTDINNLQINGDSVSISEEDVIQYLRTLK